MEPLKKMGYLLTVIPGRVRRMVGTFECIPVSVGIAGSRAFVSRGATFDGLRYSDA